MNDQELEARRAEAVTREAREIVAETATRAAAAYIATRVSSAVLLAVLMPGSIIILVGAALLCALGWIATDLTLGAAVPALDSFIGVVWLAVFVVLVVLGIRWLVVGLGRRVQGRLDAAFTKLDPAFTRQDRLASLLAGGGVHAQPIDRERRPPSPSAPAPETATLAELDARLAPTSVEKESS